VLGYFAAITLVLTVLSPLILEDIFAESFTVTFDKPVYSSGDSITISGEILDFGMPVIAMSIYDPDGKILSANNLEILPNKTFSKNFVLDSIFYEKSGEYAVKISYGKISENHFFTIDNSDPEIVIETFDDTEIILLYTDKKQYTDNDVIKITGLVSAIDSPSVLIGIYDPFGMPGGFYFGSVDSNLEFSTSFLVKSGVNFRVDGTYSIKAHYGEAEMISFFDYYEILPDTKDDPADTKDDPADTKDDPADTKDDPADTKDDPADTKDDPADTKEKSPKVQTTDTGVVQGSDAPIKKINDNNNDFVSKTNNSEFKKQNNLSVEDVELGIMLNQINLECDSSILTDTISYYDGMGPALYRLCKFDSSLNSFNESLAKTPNNTEVLANKGSALGKLGRFSEAIMYYDQALKIDPDFLPAKNNKANALANLRNYDAAISLYNEVLDKSPTYLTAKNNLDIVLSLNANIDNLDHTPTNSIENIVSTESSPISEKLMQTNQKTQEPTNFIDEISLVFSTLGSLFGFLN